LCLAPLGDFARALAVAHEGADLARANGRPELLVASRAALGGAHHFRGDFAEAIEHLERGLALCREAGIGVWLSFMTGSLGHVYALSGRPAEAQPLLDACLASARTQTRAEEALWMAWLGEAHLLAGRPAEALEVATRGLEVARAQQSRGAEVVARHLLGEIASSTDPAGAGAHYRSALALAEEIGMQPQVAHCHTGLARLYQNTGDSTAAEAHLATATALYREMGMAYWLEQASKGGAARG
jgi:tetratricopeptide (TPR) repeat protein